MKLGRRAEVDPKENWKLPTTTTSPISELRECQILIYGEKKIGKTTLCDALGNALFLTTEVGYKFLRIFNRPVESYRQLKALVSQLPGRFKWVVFDVADPIYELLQDYVCVQAGIEHPNDAQDYGKTHGKIRKLWRSLIRELGEKKMGICYLSHATWHEFTDRKGRKSNRIGPTFTGKGYDLLSAQLDLIAYYGYDDDSRKLYIRGNETLDAGCRAKDRFLTTNGERVLSIDMGDSAEDAAKALRAGWANKLADAGELPTLRKPTKDKKRR